VLYVMLGDTDEWAHERRYDLYLEAAARGDRFLRTLWETVQSMPGYRDRIALIVATDHGRGSGEDWTDHFAALLGLERNSGPPIRRRHRRSSVPETRNPGSGSRCGR
jgi:hypothetical protein